MAISEQARCRNEFFDDILNFFAEELISFGIDAEQADKAAKNVALKLHER